MKPKSENTKWRHLAKQRRWSEAEARSVVEAWRASGLRVQAFAREHDLGAWRLRYWAPRVSSGPQPGKASRAPASKEKLKFVPAVLTGAMLGERPAVVVRLPDGIAVEFDSIEHARAHDIAQLVVRLRGAGS